MDLRYGEYGSAFFQRRGLRRLPPRSGESETLGARVSPLPRPCQAAQPGCEPHL